MKSSKTILHYFIGYLYNLLNMSSKNITEIGLDSFLDTCYFPLCRCMISR